MSRHGETLAGTVDALFASGSYMTKNYTILSAAGGRGGTFDTLATVGLPAGFAASLSYTGTDAILNLTAVLGVWAVRARHQWAQRNQQNVANGLNNFFNNGGALPPGFVSVFGLTGANLGNALTLLDGEAATGAQSSTFQLVSEFLALMMDPFVDGRSGIGADGPAMGFAPEREARCRRDVSLAYASVLKAPMYKAPPFEPRWTVWGTAFGGYNRTDGDPAVAGTHNLTARTGGFAAGMDYRWRPDTTVGFALAGGGTGWSLAKASAPARAMRSRPASTAPRAGRPISPARFAYTAQWDTTDRTRSRSTVSPRDFDPQSVGGRVEGGYRYALPPDGRLTPYAACRRRPCTSRPTTRSTSGGGFGLNYAAQRERHPRRSGRALRRRNNVLQHALDAARTRSPTRTTG